MKKGFTLIELLGVVVLLAIISLISTPIILNIIKEAQESANMSSAYLIESSGHNYYAASLLDESKKEKIDNYENIYDELDIQNKPEFGQLYVNSNDKVAMAVIINNKCYKKDYMTEIEVVDVSECDLGYMGPDEVKPTISQIASNTNINENGWYKEDIYLTINVTDNESGVFGYKRCISQSECEPEDTIYTNESILINIESASNYVCVIGVDKRGNESDKNCEIYKLDKTLPTINGVGDITVNRNDAVNLSNGVTYSDTLSQIDGTLSIIPSTIDTSVTGVKEVTYSIKDKAGNVREVVRNIIVDADAPSIVFSLVDSNSINEQGWAKNDFYIRATITDNSGSGIKSGSSCTTNSSSECTPSASFTGTTKDFLITTEGSNRACVEVTDNNNKTTKVCSNTYNLDKTAPTLILSIKETTTNSVTITVDSSDGHSGTSNAYQYYIKDNNDSNYSNIANYTGSNQSYTFINLEPSGIYDIKVTIEDLAGNLSVKTLDNISTLAGATINQQWIYTSDTTFIVPQTGRYYVEIHGRGGNGGRGAFDYFAGIDAGDLLHYSSAAAGGGGGGGSGATFTLNLTYKQSYSITVATTNNNLTRSTFGSYYCNNGNDGGNGSAYTAWSSPSATAGSYGTFGNCSPEGTIIASNGETGEKRTSSISTSTYAYGGQGGTGGDTTGNGYGQGGEGGSASSSSYGNYGNSGAVIIKYLGQ